MSIFGPEYDAYAAARSAFVAAARALRVDTTFWSSCDVSCIRRIADDAARSAPASAAAVRALADEALRLHDLQPSVLRKRDYDLLLHDARDDADAADYAGFAARHGEDEAAVRAEIEEQLERDAEFAAWERESVAGW